MNGPRAPPLRYLKRDQVGPRGQKPGTTTTLPGEMDSILRRKWGEVYRGNQDDLNRGSDLFIGKYNDGFDVQETPESIAPITAEDLSEEYKKGGQIITRSGWDGARVNGPLLHEGLCTNCLPAQHH